MYIAKYALLKLQESEAVRNIVLKMQDIYESGAIL